MEATKLNKQQANEKQTKKKLQGVRCPSCGSKDIYVEAITRMFGSGYCVKCQNCYFRAETAETERKAIENWRKKKFTETSKMLSNPLRLEDMQDENVLRLTEAAIMRERAEYIAILERCKESPTVENIDKVYAEEMEMHRLIGLDESEINAAIRFIRKQVLGKSSVVRCRECKHWVKRDIFGNEYRRPWCEILSHDGEEVHTGADWYCAEGRRK